MEGKGRRSGRPWRLHVETCVQAIGGRGAGLRFLRGVSSDGVREGRVRTRRRGGKFSVRTRCFFKFSNTVRFITPLVTVMLGEASESARKWWKTATVHAGRAAWTVQSAGAHARPCVSLAAAESDAVTPTAASHEVGGPAPLRWPSGGMVARNVKGKRGCVCSVQ